MSSEPKVPRVNLAGLTALITGASSGIGAGIALSMAANGAPRAVHYHKNQEGAEGVLARIRSAGGEGACISADLSEVSKIQEFTKHLHRLLDSVHILVNNAGSLIERKPFLEIKESLWSKVFTLNVTSAFLLTQAVLPKMLERKAGSIVNVSSVAARRRCRIDRILVREGSIIQHDEGARPRIWPSRNSGERSVTWNHKH